MAVPNGIPFADSYLSGATLRSGKLLPRTVTAWMVLKDHSGAQAVLKSRGVTLVKPPPFVGVER
jgi:hypothetical protein